MSKLSAAAQPSVPNPSRLRLARKRRGLTKVTMAQRVGISAKMLGDYEKSRAVPSTEALQAIASVLRFPLAFFFRPDIHEPSEDSVSFRSLSTMRAGQRDAALAAGALAFELSEWIDAEFVLQAPDLPDLHEYEPAEAAMALRNYWGFGIRPIGNMIQTLESRGVRVFSLTERGRQIDAFSLWYQDIPFVFLNTTKTVEHGRMDAAHELGHLVLHRHGAVRSRDVETDAKIFGAEFLMPRDSVLGHVPRLTGPSFASILKMKATWGVSAAALAMRLNKLQLLSDHSYRGICIELSKYGRTREPLGLAVRETSAVLAKVFDMLKDAGMSKADVAKRLDLYTEDLEALIFGLGQLEVTAAGGTPRPNAAAETRRRQFKVYG